MLTIEDRRVGTIDVVEDDHSVRVFLEAVVQRCGHRPRTFATAEAYLANEAVPRPACLILDYAPPSMDGLALMAELSRRGDLPPVIAVSGRADVAAAVRFMECGAVTLLEKPFAVDRLERAIEQAVRINEQRGAILSRYDDLSERIARLSEREHAVLREIAEGRLNKAIANDLDVSVRTVESDRSRIVEKMGATTAGEAVAKFAEHRTLSWLGYGPLQDTQQVVPRGPHAFRGSPITPTAAASETTKACKQYNGRTA